MSKVEIIKRPVDQAGSTVKKAAWSAVLESTILMVLGLLCILWPDTVVTLIAFIVGGFFIVRGGVIIISYFMEEGHKDYFNNKLLSGVICVLLGIAALVAGQAIAQVFSVVVGILIIYESLVRLNTATKLRAANVNNWKQLIVIALIMMVIGIIGIVGDVIFIQHVNMVIDKLAGKK